MAASWDTHLRPDLDLLFLRIDPSRIRDYSFLLDIDPTRDDQVSISHTAVSKALVKEQCRDVHFLPGIVLDVKFQKVLIDNIVENIIPVLVMQMHHLANVDLILVHLDAFLQLLPAVDDIFLAVVHTGQDPRRRLLGGFSLLFLG